MYIGTRPKSLNHFIFEFLSPKTFVNYYRKIW